MIWLSAMKAVQAGIIGVNEAAIKHGVSKTTLSWSNTVTRGAQSGPEQHLNNKETSISIPETFCCYWLLKDWGGSDEYRAESVAKEKGTLNDMLNPGWCQKFSKWKGDLSLPTATHTIVAMVPRASWDPLPVQREPDTDPTSAPALPSGNTIVSSVCRSLPTCSSSAEAASRMKSPSRSAISELLVHAEPLSVTERSFPCATSDMKGLAMSEETENNEKRKKKKQERKRIIEEEKGPRKFKWRKQGKAYAVSQRVPRKIGYHTVMNEQYCRFFSSQCW